MEYGDVELGLHQYNEDAYSIDFRFSLPGSDADIRLGQNQPIRISFNLTQLREAEFSPETYGRRLSEQLFNPPELRSALAQARGAAAAAEVRLRLRLLIGASAPELHNLRWETLVDLDTGIPFASDENILFSRFLTSLDWRPVRLLPKGSLRGLVMVAAPADLSRYNLAAIDVTAEVERARTGFEGIPLEQLPRDDSPASLENLLAALRQDPPFDLIYLVCHGAMVNGQPYLFLENQDRSVQRVPGSDLVLRLQQLQQRPRLMLLLSCESAGDGTGSALAALGPRLAEIGIPAVIAMQSAFTMVSAQTFIPVFFSELQRDGQIDRAVAAARSVIRGRPDAWCPALFMRLKSGRLWYEPGFRDRQVGAERLPSLVRNIRRGRCTPILGPGLVEPVLGSLREIARRWAEDYRYPLAPHERESLPQVAQFLSINQDASFPFFELEDSLKKHIRDSFSPTPLDGNLSLQELVNQAGAARRAAHEYEPHRVLAKLPLPIFITSNQDQLLEKALLEANKNPQTILCPWNEYIEQSKTIFERELDYQPTPDRPVVFHLFGVWDQPDSVVLTEDQYFDFLTGVTGNKSLIPEQIRLALADSGLLFLGFQTEDWSFRVIFRSLLLQPGARRRSLYTHIAAQIEPEDGRILEPLRARSYLEKYFSKGADIDIFWGSPEEFMAELAGYMNKNG